MPEVTDLRKRIKARNDQEYARMELLETRRKQVQEGLNRVPLPGEKVPGPALPDSTGNLPVGPAADMH